MILQFTNYFKIVCYTLNINLILSKLEKRDDQAGHCFVKYNSSVIYIQIPQARELCYNLSTPKRMAKNRENAAAGANTIHEKRKYTRWTEEEHRYVCERNTFLFKALLYVCFSFKFLKWVLLGFLLHSLLLFCFNHYFFLFFKHLIIFGSKKSDQ